MFLLLLAFLAVSPTASTPTTDDPLWLRYDPIPNPSPYAHLKTIAIHSTASVCHDPIQVAALNGIADELSTGLSGLLARPISSTITCHPHHSYNTVQNTTTALTVSISNANTQTPEGFTLTTAPYSIIANTPSGGLYGTFRFLSVLQQHKTPATTFTSSPAMKIRAWDLWDTVSGTVEQGHDGNSLIWPYAIYNSTNPPSQTKVFLAATCNSSDPFQQWESTAFSEGVLPGTIRNVGSNTCLTSMTCNPGKQKKRRIYCQPYLKIY